MTLEALVFDMDGVLVDSEPLHLETTNVILGAEGHGLTEAENREYIGTNEPAYWTALVERFDLSDRPEVYIGRREELLLEAIGRGLPIAPGVEAFLRSAHVAGLPVAVASSSDRSVIDGILAHGGLTDLFDAVASGDEVERPKPDPEIFRLAASRLGVDPLGCLVFEDSPNGARGALAAGMRCIRVVTETTRTLEFPAVTASIESFEGLSLDALLAENGADS